LTWDAGSIPAASTISNIVRRVRFLAAKENHPKTLFSDIKQTIQENSVSIEKEIITGSKTRGSRSQVAVLTPSR